MTMDHIEELEDHQTPAARGRPLANTICFILVAAALVAGWRYLRPASALASGDWLTDWDQAVEKSRATGKPALVLFTADWCPACRQFETQTLSDEQVQKYLRQNYTLVVVDLSDRNGPNAIRAQEFGVRGIPMLIVYDAAGQERARSYGMAPDDMLKWLK
jgi:thiol:disulfide interchange protein DsbD